MRGGLWMQEGRVADGPAVRLVVRPLRGAELVYAPGLDPAHVIATPSRELAEQCGDASFLAGGAIHVATARPGATRAFVWDRDALAAMHEGDLVGLVMCSTRTDITGTDLGVLRQFVERVHALAASAPSPTAPEPRAAPEPQPVADHGAATRRWLDGNRDAILGCAGRDTVIVRVERRSGAAHVALQPPLAGTAEEECVRAALGSAPANAIPSAAVIHAVR